MVVRAMLAAQLCIPRIGYNRPPTSLLHSRRVLCSAAASSQLPPVLYYNDHYEVPLPPTHRFPMQKYREVRLALQRELAAVQSARCAPLSGLSNHCASSWRDELYYSYNKPASQTASQPCKF